MKQIWKERGRRWSLFKIKHFTRNNPFVPIPQEYEHDESIKQGHNAISNNGDPQPSNQDHCIIKNIFHIGTKSKVLQANNTNNDGIYSTSNHLNTKQLTAITFFALAAGSFGFQESYALGGPMLMFISSFFIPWLWCLPISLMTIEMSCMIPESGGHVLWVYRAFGPFWSYLNGFFAFACSVLDNALFPSLFIEYLSALLPKTTNNSSPLNYVWSVTIKMLMLIFATVINIVGIGVVGNVSLVLAFIVVASFVIVYCGGIKYMNLHWMGIAIPKQVNRGKFLANVLWNTSGLDLVGTCASEVLTPSISYPQSSMYAISLLLVTSIIPGYICSSIFSHQEDWNIKTYFDVAKIVGGNSFEGWMGVVGLFDMLGLLLTRLCANSRILYGMAQVDLMPSAFTLLHPKFATPWVAILTSSFCTLIFNFFNFYHLAEADMLFYALSTLLKLGALIQLRYTEPNVLRPYQLPLEKELLIVFTCFPMIMCIIILICASERSQGIALIGATIAIFSYICKECFAQYGTKEITQKRLVRLQENLERMQKRIDVVIESEVKVLQTIHLINGKSADVVLKNWGSRAKERAKERLAAKLKKIKDSSKSLSTSIVTE